MSDKKVDSDLEPISGETVMFEAHPSMFRNQPLWFVGVILLFLLGIVLCFVPVFNYGPSQIAILGGILLLIAAIVFFVWWLKCKGTTLTVTNERTSCRRGILSKSITEVWHQDIRNVQLDQTFFQRVLDVGKIGISSAGQSGLEINVAGIPKPGDVKRLIDEHRRRD